MRTFALLGACALATCGAPEPRRATTTAAPAVPPDAPAIDAPALEAIVEPALAGDNEQWLKGSTHVHARPSGDSTTPVTDVIRWYESNGYDFIVLTDHNKVTDAAQAPEQGLIVVPGIELTHNPAGCTPKLHDSDQCRIHVNLLGVTGRPEGKVAWAERKSRDRLAKYDAALAQQKTLGGLVQLNHPSWFWGMTADLLTELARRGFSLVEIRNIQFETWNDGDVDHPSTEALWDAALLAGVTLWGVASDDAHHYGGGKWPAGGGWVVVKAARDPGAILASLSAGRFYSSTGVVLARAELDGDELVVEVPTTEPGTYSIAWIENAAPVATISGRRARRRLPVTGYLRAVVTRDDGRRAWVQPARR